MDIRNKKRLTKKIVPNNYHEVIVFGGNNEKRYDYYRFEWKSRVVR